MATEDDSVDEVDSTLTATVSSAMSTYYGGNIKSSAMVTVQDNDDRRR